jgi:hypothetical protein
MLRHVYDDQLSSSYAGDNYAQSDYRRLCTLNDVSIRYPTPKNKNIIAVRA